MRSRSRWSALAAVAAVVTAIMLIGAGSASAYNCTTDIRGEGASLQRLAQTEWIGLYIPICIGGRTVSFTASGSGAGLNAWRANTGTGTLPESNDHFIATDDAPSPGQVANISAAGNGVGVPVLPVLQAAVSVVYNPLEGCAGLTNIDNRDLEAIWRGAITDWSRVLGAPGECRGTITRIVRQDVSGTTFQFKHYLWLINEAANIVGGKSWLTLQTNENLEWPGTVTTPGSSGGGALVSLVASTRGSIGYANFADALANGSVRIFNVQNNGLEQGEGKTYASPLDGRGANCLSTTYRNNLGRGTSITPELETDWSTIYGSDPDVATNSSNSAAYPICTLSWDVVVLDYVSAGFTAAQGASVRNYLQFALEGTAQTLLLSKNYAPIPSNWFTAVRGIIGEIN